MSFKSWVPNHDNDPVCFKNVSIFAHTSVWNKGHTSKLASLLYPIQFYLLGKGGYVFGSAGLFVCLFSCKHHHSKT